DFPEVILPRTGLARVAGELRRRAKEVVANESLALDEAGLNDDSVADELRLAGVPGHLLDRGVLIEPERGLDSLPAAVVDEGKPRVDRRRGPELARRPEDVVVLGHIRAEVLDRDRRRRRRRRVLGGAELALDLLLPELDEHVVEVL